MSEREYLIAKANRDRRRDAYAAAAGVGGVATTGGLIAGGVPGMKDPNSDWGRLKQAKMPRNKAQLKESAKHVGAAGRGGILGYRVAAHKHVLRETDAKNWDVSHHGETTHHGHYGRGVDYGRPHPEKVIIRQMSRGRKIANRTALAGGAATAIGLKALKGRELHPRTEAQRSADRTRATGTGLLAGGAATTGGSLAGGAFLSSRGRKWARFAQAKGEAAEKLAPGIGPTRRLYKPKGTGVPRIRPDVKDDKMWTRPNAFAGTTKEAAERAGALRGAAKQGGYFARTYGRSAKAVRRVGAPAGVAMAGGGALIRMRQRKAGQR